MKYSLSVRQPDSELKNADEIRITYNDINIIYDKSEMFSSKEYVILISNEHQVDWKELENLNEIIYIQVGVDTLEQMEMAKSYNISFFWNHPINTYNDLLALIEVGVSSIIPGSSLYFDLPELKRIIEDRKIRMCANKCHEGFFPFENGIKGTYIRPEDVPVYEEYVDMIFFDTDILSREAQLFKIYKRELWSGNLNLILDNFEFDVDNRGIVEEFGTVRLSCRQNCMRTKRCHFCDSAMNFTKALNKYKRYIM